MMFHCVCYGALCVWCVVWSGVVYGLWFVWCGLCVGVYMLYGVYIVVCLWCDTCIVGCVGNALWCGMYDVWFVVSVVWFLVCS